MTRGAVIAGSLLLAASCSSGCVRERPASSWSSGIVLDTVGATGAGHQAGLRNGDVLIAWTREPGGAEGEFRSPFDLHDVEFEQAPRGAIAVRSRRGASETLVTIPPGEWKIGARPALGAADEKAFEAALGHTPDARRLASVRELAAGAARRGDRLLAAWFLQRAASLEETSRRWRSAARLYADAVEHATAAGDLAAVAWLHRSAGFALARDGTLAESEAAHRKALEAIGGRGRDSVRAALSTYDLAMVALIRRDLAVAEREFERARALLHASAPRSLWFAAAVDMLAAVRLEQGDIAGAEEGHRHALQLRRAVAPAGPETAYSLHNLGLLLARRGDLARAEEYIGRALELKRPAAPPRSLAFTLMALGGIRGLRGDESGARQLYLESLELLRADGSDLLAIAQNEMQLADLERDWRRYEAARTHYRGALETFRRFTPDSSRLVPVLNRLGRLELHLGNADVAADILRQALALVERSSSAGAAAAETLHGLGLVWHHTGDPRAAREFLQRALDIQARIAPGTTALAESYHAMGAVLRDQGQLEPAALAFSNAIAALESQLGRLGGTAEVRSGFRDRHIEIYREHTEILLKLGRKEEAFAELERSRAQELLAMLAARDLTFPKDVPADLDRERRLAAMEYDRAQARLAALSPGANTGEVEKRLQELRDIRARQERIRGRLRTLSPRVAALRYPAPLDLAEAARALDEGTAVLAYAAGRQRTRIFVVGLDRRLHVADVNAGAAQLAEEVDRFRILIEARSDDHRTRAAIVERGGRLFRQLIGPVEQHITDARRVLIVPDGPLNVLPFAALTRPAPNDATGREWQYFVEWKPLHQIVSLTVYSEVRKGSDPEPRGARSTIVAFGDPGTRARNLALAGADPGRPVRSGIDVSLGPLPWSRDEVRTIAALYHPHAASFVGDAATEAQVKTVAPGADILHFSTHALVDRRFPLDSGLVLATAPSSDPPQDNGLLQAWEVLEELRLRARLVVLSGCETGLGEHSPGGGLIGLSRAFLYAGARAVLASHWRIADRSTSALMTRFHVHLRDGRAAADALRAAQIDLIRGRVKPPSQDAAAGFISRWWRAQRWHASGAPPPTPADFSHPYHWAAFHLIGLPH